MNQLQKTVFISDLHLEATQPANTSAFLNLLQTCQQQRVDALYILGDLFEVWIGDDDNSAYNLEIISALKSATDHGLKIYFLHGNRDFLIGKKFMQKTGCKLIDDETVISVYGQRVLLMHGDVLCTDDTEYLKSRKWMRKWWLQKLFMLLPLSKRKKIAAKMRDASSDHMRTLTESMMDVSQNAVKAVMQKHHVAYLIHGHTHKPNIHRFNVLDSAATRMVLAAWHGNSLVCVWDETGKFALTESDKV